MDEQEEVEVGEGLVVHGGPGGDVAMQSTPLPEAGTVVSSHSMEDDQPLVILDPDHPLMRRVQAVLKDQLLRRNEKLENDLKEKRETLKSLQKNREALGVDLYSMQQQLARHQMQVEEQQDKHAAAQQTRAQREAMLEDIRMLYRDMMRQVKNERQQTVSLQHESEKMAERLMILNEAHKNMKNDVAVAQRATQKTTSDVTIAQDEMRRQDLFVDHLTSVLYKHEEQVSLYDAQYAAQAKETQAVREAVTEATMELETVLLEKKRLMQQWNSTLIGMRRRDEAFAAMQEAMRMQHQDLKNLDNEVENYKKTILKEQETNENLTLHHNKACAEENHVKKQIETTETKRSQLRTEYTMYGRVLQETSQALAKENTDCSVKRNELDGLRIKLEREALAKRELDRAVMEKKIQRLTIDKASQSTAKAIHLIRKKGEELEVKITNVENEISKILLQIADVTSELRRLQQLLDEQNAVIQQRNTLITSTESEMVKNQSRIERKQTQIDQLSKKIAIIVTDAGGKEETGPLELQIEGLRKQILDSVDECNKLQQFWLRDQNNLVKQTKELDSLRHTISTLEKTLLIMDQKKLRIDDQLIGEQRECAAVEYRNSGLQKDLTRLSTLLVEKKGQQENMEQSNILLETDFIRALKEEELESIQLQGRLDSLKEEKERLLNSLMESERQLLLWDKKTQLAKEMKELVHSDEGQSEVRALKTEIHQMQGRFSKMMKTQEKLIQEMEKCIHKREHIIMKGDLQTLSGKKEQTQGHLEKKMQEKQRDLQTASKESASIDAHLGSLRNAQDTITEEMETFRSSSHQLTAAINGLEEQVQYAEQTKKRGMLELIAGQSKVKSLTAAKEGRYKLVCRTAESCEAEWTRQLDKMQSLQAILEHLVEDFPSARTDLQNTLLSIKARVAPQGTTEHVQTETQPEEEAD